MVAGLARAEEALLRTAGAPGSRPFTALISLPVGGHSSEVGSWLAVFFASVAPSWSLPSAS